MTVLAYQGQAMRQMKIVLLCNEYPPWSYAGGLGITVQTLARGLSQKGHNVTVVGLGETDAEHRDLNIRVFTLRRTDLRYLGNLISRVRLRRWLSAHVKAEGVDIIESPEWQGLLPFGLNGCPVVIRLHQSSTTAVQAIGGKAGRGISLYERRTLAANSNWIAVSNHIMDLTRAAFQVHPKRWTIIHNPVPPAPSPLPDPPSLPANYILHVGQVRRRKGVLVLAEAARDLMAERPDLHLVYAGAVFKENGRMISEEIREILGPRVNPRVHFLGHLEREIALACMAGAKVFAFPSQLEALPLVVIEAMSCGTPVVFTRFPPGPEIIEDGVTGLLADPDSPKDFGEKIARILNDPQLSSRLGGAARRRVAEAFSVEKCVEATERFYEKCLAQ
jgi:glycosyltransferase involved in cell wall biosynthesis